MLFCCTGGSFELAMDYQSSFTYHRCSPYAHDVVTLHLIPRRRTIASGADKHAKDKTSASMFDEVYACIDGVGSVR